jgi:hypothetical protein
MVLTGGRVTGMQHTRNEVLRAVAQPYQDKERMLACAVPPLQDASQRGGTDQVTPALAVKLRGLIPNLIRDLSPTEGVAGPPRPRYTKQRDVQLGLPHHSTSGSFESGCILEHLAADLPRPIEKIL